MKTKIFFVLLVLIALPAYSAKKIKIIKAKGNKAIVQFPKSMKLEDNQFLYVSDSEEGSTEFQEATHGPRGKSLLLNGGFHSLSIKSEVTSDEEASESEVDEEDDNAKLPTRSGFDVYSAFIFNLGYFEFGPLLSFSTDKTSSSSTFNDVTSSVTTNNMTFKIGGLVDINFIKNESPSNFIPAATLTAGYKMGSSKTHYEGMDIDDPDPSKYSGFGFSGGLAAKWFALTPQTSIRLTLEFMYDVTSSSSTIKIGEESKDISTSTTEYGPMITFGIQPYF